MPRVVFMVLVSGAILSGSLLSAVRTDQTGAETRDLIPFTNIAYIPAGSDLHTIRLERVRTVMVPAKIRYATNKQYCAEVDAEDEGESAYCPSVTTESAVAAYELTYSFDAPFMSSDESGERRSTFSVYLRPEDLTPAMQSALSAAKPNLASIGKYFAVDTHRAMVSGKAVDVNQSHFCDGGYADGNWIQKKADCTDEVSYKTVAVPSETVTVRIDSVVARPGPGAMATR